MVEENQVLAAKPIVSVICGVFNGAGELRMCLDSILAQTIGQDAMEVILIDDASTDGTRDIIAEYESAYPCVRALYRAENSGGAGGPKKDGLKIARGEYVYFIDHDDWFGPEALERLVNHAREWGSDTVQGRIVDVKDNTQKGATAYFASNKDSIPDAKIGTHGVLTSSLSLRRLVKRSLLVEHGITLRDDVWYEDMIFSLELYAHANVCSLANDYDYYFLRRDSRRKSVSSPGASTTMKCKSCESMVGGLSAIFDIVDEFFPTPELNGKLMKKLFTHPVRTAIRNVRLHVDQHVEEYPEGAQPYQERCWKRVKDYYTDEVRESLDILPAVYCDCFAAGKYDVEDVTITSFCRPRKQRSLGKMDVFEGEVPANELLRSVRSDEVAFLSDSVYERLLRAQWESAQIECDSHVRANGVLRFEGTYFLPLLVEKGLNATAVLQQAESGSASATTFASLKFTPEVWGEPLQAKGRWTLEFPVTCENAVSCMPAILCPDGKRHRLIPISAVGSQDLADVAALLTQAKVLAVDAASFKRGVISVQGGVSLPIGLADDFECELRATFYEFNGDGDVLFVKSASAQVRKTSQSTSAQDAHYAAQLNLADVDKSIYANGGVWKIGLRLSSHGRHRDIALGATMPDDVRKLYVGSTTFKGGTPMISAVTKYGNLLVRAKKR